MPQTIIELPLLGKMRGLKGPHPEGDPADSIRPPALHSLINVYLDTQGIEARWQMHAIELDFQRRVGTYRFISDSQALVNFIDNFVRTKTEAQIIEASDDAGAPKVNVPPQHKGFIWRGGG